MNKISKTILLSALTFAFLAGCDQKQSGTTTNSAAPSATAAKAQQHTCTMHPEVVQDGPGKCPKCGMDLVPKTNS